MKKYLLFLILAALCCGEAVQAQRYVSRYKKKKEVREYDLGNEARKWTVTFGGSYNMALGAMDRIRYIDRDYTTRYDVKPSMGAGSVRVGVGYKVNDNIVTGLETGVAFQDSGETLPLYGTFSYYYGPSKSNNRHRWFNYVNLGPQFSFSGSTKTGAMAGAGGGVRVVVGQSLKVDFRLGYQINMCRPDIASDGKYDLPASGVRFKHYTHILEFGLGFVIF